MKGDIRQEYRKLGKAFKRGEADFLEGFQELESDISSVNTTLRLINAMIKSEENCEEVLELLHSVRSEIIQMLNEYLGTISPKTFEYIQRINECMDEVVNIEKQVGTRDLEDLREKESMENIFEEKERLKKIFCLESYSHRKSYSLHRSVEVLHDEYKQNSENLEMKSHAQEIRIFENNFRTKLEDIEAKYNKLNSKRVNKDEIHAQMKYFENAIGNFETMFREKLGEIERKYHKLTSELVNEEKTHAQMKHFEDAIGNFERMFRAKMEEMKAKYDKLIFERVNKEEIELIQHSETGSEMKVMNMVIIVLLLVWRCF